MDERSAAAQKNSGNNIPRRKKRRKFYSFLGVFMLIMSVIGLFSTIGFTAKNIGKIISKTALKNEMADLIYPVVICDPPYFESVNGLRSETVISASIWDIILHEDKSKYKADFDYITVPETDVDLHAKKLFGNDLAIEHRSIISSDLQFYYSEEIKSYKIPSNPQYFSYSPVIVKITKKGSECILTVGYLSPVPEWQKDEKKRRIPDKYAEYVLRKNGNSYIVLCIRPSDFNKDKDSYL